jgi:hypothetical protein
VFLKLVETLLSFWCSKSPSDYNLLEEKLLLWVVLAVATAAEVSLQASYNLKEICCTKSSATFLQASGTHSS